MIRECFSKPKQQIKKNLMREKKIIYKIKTNLIKTKLLRLRKQNQEISYEWWNYARS